MAELRRSPQVDHGWLRGDDRCRPRKGLHDYDQRPHNHNDEHVDAMDRRPPMTDPSPDMREVGKTTTPTAATPTPPAPTTPTPTPTPKEPPSQQPGAVASAAIERLAGTCRYTTNLALNQEKMKPNTPVFIATGANFPDALSAAAAGGAVNAPVLLGNGASAPSLSAAQTSALSRSKTKTVHLVGGTGVVNARLEANIRAKGYSTSRLFGSNRYATNAAVNRYVDSKVGTSVTDMWVATGQNFPDALSAAAPAGNGTSRLVLSGGACLPKDSVSSILGTQLDRVHLVGGSGVLGPSIAALKQC